VSGHSKWSSIKHKKGAADAKRGKLFSKLSRAIIVAAREGGPDPAANLALQNAIEKARSYSMPKDNIERAIAKGAGADAEASDFETVVYEGYGPEGVAVLVEALTDNRNRTASDVRHLFSKHGGNLGTTGAVAWQFERRGVVLVQAEGVDEEALLLAAADAGAGDVSLDGSSFEISSPPEALAAVRLAVEAAGFRVESAGLAMIPKTTVAIADESTARKVMHLVEGLEDADLLLHVVDVSHPNLHERMRVIDDTLAGLGLGERPRLLVLNKADALRGAEGDALREALGAEFPAAVFTGWIYDQTQSYTYALIPFMIAYGVAGLILWRLPHPERPTRLEVPASQAVNIQP
jgi:YebC/PmpR family DNA-binding regulatory protein